MSKRCRPLVPISSEEAEQRVLVAWLTIRGVVFAHVPNGGHRAISEARRLKAMGVMPGIPDILIFDPPPNRPLCFATALELKRAHGGKVSVDQQSWLIVLRSRRWAAEVCYGAKAAIDWLMELGY